MIVLCMILETFSFSSVNAETGDTDTIQIGNMPVMGKWMMNSAGAPANWLGQKYKDKEMREPINLIIIDEVSSSSDEAITRLESACTSARSGRYKLDGKYDMNNKLSGENDLSTEDHDGYAIVLVRCSQ